MILTNDFLQKKIYKENLHLGKSEFYSGLSHGRLVENNFTQTSGIKSCNDESAFFGLNPLNLRLFKNLQLFGQFVKTKSIICAKMNILMAYSVCHLHKDYVF